MTQLLTVETSSDTSLAISANTLAPDEGPNTKYAPYRNSWQFTLADTADADAVIADIESQLSSANWYEIRYQWRGDEYDDATYRDDTGYRHESHELAAPPVIEQTGAYEVTVSASWVTNGTLHTADATLQIDDAVTDYSRSDTIVGTSDGTITTNGSGVVLGSVMVKDPLPQLPAANISARSYPNTVERNGIVASQGTRPEASPTAERVRDLERAVGKGTPAKRGIASRLDDLESRIESLEGQ